MSCRSLCEWVAYFYLLHKPEHMWCSRCFQRLLSQYVRTWTHKLHLQSYSESQFPRISLLNLRKTTIKYTQNYSNLLKLLLKVITILRNIIQTRYPFFIQFCCAASYLTKKENKFCCELIVIFQNQNQKELFCQVRFFSFAEMYVEARISNEPRLGICLGVKSLRYRKYKHSANIHKVKVIKY